MLSVACPTALAFDFVASVSAFVTPSGPWGEALILKHTHTHTHSSPFAVLFVVNTSQHCSARLNSGVSSQLISQEGIFGLSEGAGLFKVV